MEKRLLLAFVLSAVIFAIWSMLFPPAVPEPETVDGRRPEAAQPVAEGEREAVRSADRSEAVAEEPAQERDVPVSEAQSLETVRLANDVMALELTNRGAAVASFQLLDYRGDEGEVLDLVQRVNHPDAALPLQLVTEGSPDVRLYLAQAGERRVRFRWADGNGNGVTKTISIPASGYGVEFEIEGMGSDARAPISVGSGLRNLSESEQNSRLARWGDVVVLADGEYREMRRTKVKQAEEIVPRSLSYVGFHDTYFLELLRPKSEVEAVLVVPLEVLGEEGDDGERVLEVLVRPGAARLEGELLGAPKEYTLLHEIGGGVERTLDFGIFGPISVIFLKALWWIHGVVGNYGVAIILLTLGIRILLFPLMHTSTVSMRKMQRLQPKVKEIQARYKKKKTDPQARAKMNQEMMALYKQEGVNPMGGCLPMLVQLPILWALYKLFLHAIELRHAPFLLWIDDLSAKDPYYITPILMTLTMWLQQRLAPQVGDPQQQRIMRFLPLVFGIMFLQFPSGLVLYWLANNVITIAQQEITLHLLGERGRRSGGGK